MQRRRMTAPWTVRLARIVVAAMIFTRVEAVLLACPVCFQIQDGPTASGVRAAVVVLIGVTTAVLSGFGVFIARFIRRQGIEGRMGALPRPDSRL
jgi:uncharacterized membrane protein